MSGIDLSTLWREKTLDLLTGTSPAQSRYVALLSTAATVTQTGSTIAEVSYSGYVRQSIPSWGATVGSRRLNDTRIVFAPVNLGLLEVVGLAIVTASTAGELVAFCEFSTAELMQLGESPVFEIGTLALATAGVALV